MAKERTVYTLFPIINKRLETPDNLEDYSREELLSMKLFEVRVGEPIKALSRNSGAYNAEMDVPDEQTSWGDPVYTLIHVLSPEELAAFVEKAQEALNQLNQTT